MAGFGIYDQIREGCQRSAAVAVPMLHDLFHPATIVDVGGGEGWWAAEFARRGCSALVVDNGLPVQTLAGDGVKFVARDLDDPHYALCRPPVERYDLALCLEVAEHLDPLAAEPLVKSLCALAPFIAFSAAVPGQGGHGHLNEQWPGYWVTLFAACGYRVSGALRWRLWGNPQVEPWYQQNLLVAVDEHAPLGAWATELFSPCAFAEPVPLVHPVTFAHHRGVPAP